MFEKEAEEYAIDNYETCLYDDLPYANDSIAREQAYKDGAEFGYNKALEELKELKADNDARKFAMTMSEKVEKQLREQIEKMKCCQNCKNCAYAGFEIICRTYDCINNSKWELKE